MPGHLSAPVVINGFDVSGAVVEGDWGLYRPGQVAPTVYYPFLAGADRGYARAYYPFTGMRPRYGRKEIIPPAGRRLPPRAESYHRYWSTESAPLPAQTDYPAFVAPVVVAPRVRAFN